MGYTFALGDSSTRSDWSGPERYFERGTSLYGDRLFRENRTSHRDLWFEVI